MGRYHMRLPLLVIVGLASRACGFQIRPATKLGGAGAQLVASAGAPRDWSGEVGALFTNLRTPAALVAGATFGGAFGLPLSPADDLFVGIAKRLHVVVAVLSLGAELLVMIASTVALQGMSSAAVRSWRSILRHLGCALPASCH